MNIITYNTKLIFESEKDKSALFEILRAEQTCFNIASELFFGHSPLSIKNLHHISYRKIRNKYPNIPSQVVIRALNSVLSSYRCIKSNKHKIKSHPIKSKLSIQLDKRLYTYKDEKLKLISFEKRLKVNFIKYPKLVELIAKYKFGDPELFVRNNEIYINLSFKIPPVEQTGKDLAIGVDLGINRVAATSDGKIFKCKEYNGKKRQLRYLKRNLQAKATKSARKHLFKIRRTEANRSKELCRQIANKLLQTKANVIVLEDLSKLKENIKKKNKFRKINKLSQVPFYMLRSIIEYKALLLGKRVITVSPSFTSQIDHRTRKKDGTRKGSRYYCKNGQVLDADVNAAINIAIRSKLPFSSSNGLDGQAAVIRPIEMTVFSNLMLRQEVI